MEDNLVALRILNSEIATQKQAVTDAKHALQIVMNGYKAGTVAFSDVLTAQINAFTADKALIDIISRQMVTAVKLIKALGGGFKEEISPTPITNNKFAP